MTYPSPADAPPVSGWPPPRQAPTDTVLSTDRNIQGNVLAGFNKDLQTLLFVSWPNADAARAWLTDLRPRLSTNADVSGFNQRFSKARRAGVHDPDMAATWTNLSFTADGMAMLAPTEMQELRQAPGLDRGVGLWLTGAADTSVASRVGDAGDSAPENWLFGSPQTPVHAVVCAAADRISDLGTEIASQRARAARHKVLIVFEQPGATLPGSAAGHEHFGFRDGISQPGVTGFDPASEEPGREDEVAGHHGTDLIAAGTFILGYPRDHADPVAVPAWMFDGSFLVTRRLVQDVPGFWAGVELAHSKITGAPRTDPEKGIPSADALAAKLVGRWRSGTPNDAAAVFDNRSAHDPANDNDFDFEQDPTGDKTPVCAHIRKVYPRKGAQHTEQVVTEDESKMRRILRRGIPFGQPFQPTAGKGAGTDSERGLVFQCYQASLDDQFVFLQQAWINAAAFPNSNAGNDAVIGLTSDVTVRAGGTNQTLTFQNFVRTQGSLFSFTPSFSTLDRLIGAQPLPSIS